MFPLLNVIKSLSVCTSVSVICMILLWLLPEGEQIMLLGSASPRRRLMACEEAANVWLLPPSVIPLSPCNAGGAL